jgi:hypothetical protein
MNHWTELSLDFANQRNYLDELFKIYPIIPGKKREIDSHIWAKLKKISTIKIILN